jgi:hypothetical protein
MKVTLEAVVGFVIRSQQQQQSAALAKVTACPLGATPSRNAT